MKKLSISLLALVMIAGIACQKELSFELGDSPAEGSLQSDVSGDCLPKSVNGIYAENSALVPTVNTITVTVNVTKTGTYAIGTDTVNGYYFRGTGTFTALGANTVTLRGNGTPFAQGTNNFVVSFDGTVCDIQVTVLPPGAGLATFTLAGAPGNCTTPTINGVYVTGGALNATNTVILNVNVTVAGTYNVSTTATNGMTFAGTGSLATGAQTITLTGTGTPTAAGNTTIPVTVGSTTCSFTIPVVAPVTGTLGGGPGACTPATINGSYLQGVALTAGNTVQVQITTSAVGPYSVSTNTVAGISFSGTGTSTAAAQTITLNGTGTPTASGPQNFTVTFGTSTCTFQVNIQGPAVFTVDCPNVIVNGTYQVGVALNGSNTIDIPVNTTTAGPYNISVSVNGMTFSGSGTLALGAGLITLTGSGTPTSSGTSTLTVAGCNIPIPVIPAPTIDWRFTVGTTTYQGSTAIGGVLFDNTSLPPATLLDYAGDNPAGDDFSFSLIDLGGGMTATETYTTNTALPVNLGAFYFLGTTLDLTADPSTTNVTMIFRITSHNTATKTIIGTFSGTAFDANTSTIVTVTNGSFTAIYP